MICHACSSSSRCTSYRRRYLRLSQRVFWKRCMPHLSRTSPLLMVTTSLLLMALSSPSPLGRPASAEQDHHQQLFSYYVCPWDGWLLTAHHVASCSAGMACRLHSSRPSWMPLASCGRVVLLWASLLHSSLALLPLEVDRRSPLPPVSLAA